MKRDDVLHKFGDVILKFAGQTPTASTFAESSGGGGNTLNLSDDFIKLDTDFQAASFEAIKLGVDTLKLHVSSEGANDSFIKWAGDVVEPRGIGQRTRACDMGRIDDVSGSPIGAAPLARTSNNATEPTVE